MLDRIRSDVMATFEMVSRARENLMQASRGDTRLNNLINQILQTGLNIDTNELLASAFE